MLGELYKKNYKHFACNVYSHLYFFLFTVGNNDHGKSICVAQTVDNGASNGFDSQGMDALKRCIAWMQFELVWINGNASFTHIFYVKLFTPLLTSCH